MAYYNGVQSVTNATVTGNPGRRASQCNIEISYVNANGGTDNVILRVNDATQLRSADGRRIACSSFVAGQRVDASFSAARSDTARRWRAPIPSPSRARAASWAWISTWADEGIIKNSPGRECRSGEFQAASRWDFARLQLANGLYPCYTDVVLKGNRKHGDADRLTRYQPRGQRRKGGESLCVQKKRRRSRSGRRLP